MADVPDIKTWTLPDGRVLFTVVNEAYKWVDLKKPWTWYLYCSVPGKTSDSGRNLLAWGHSANMRLAMDAGSKAARYRIRKAKKVKNQVSWDSYTSHLGRVGECSEGIKPLKNFTDHRQIGG